MKEQYSYMCQSMVQMENSKRSTHGNSFNKQVEFLLKELEYKGNIKDFTKEPEYCALGYKKAQFKPDFEIRLNDGSIIIIDNTTTIRSDRMKQKQWDAMGTKQYFEKNGDVVLYFVVVPNSFSETSTETDLYETHLYELYKNNILYGEMLSYIDDVIKISELLDIIAYN